MDNNLNMPITFNPRSMIYPNEQFVPITENIIPGIMNYYIISNYARLFNIYTGRFVAGIVINGMVWMQLTTVINGSISTYQIELDRLMMLVFDYQNKAEFVKHKDGLKNSYYVDNLEWTDQCQDPKYQKIVNGQRVAYGESCYMAKLDDTKVHQICRLLEEGKLSQVEISKRFNVSPSVILNIKKGRSWKHISSQYNLPEINHDNRGENNPTSKLTEKEVREICRLLSLNKYTYVEIAKKLGGIVTPSHVSHIRNKTCWKHISDQYNIPENKGKIVGEGKNNSVITEAQAITICELLQKGIGATDIHKMLDIPLTVVNNIKGRTSWTYISKNYVFNAIRKSEMKGENIHNSIYTNEQIRNVCKLLQDTSKTQKEISKITGVSCSLVNHIVKRKSWVHISEKYIWPHREK